MKIVLVFLIIVLLPISTWAMTPLTDSELSNINGQAGVSIMLNIRMNIHFDVIAWGDSDGLGTNNIWGIKTTGGYLGVTNLTITNFYVGPRTDANYYYWLYPITIDVANIISHKVGDAYTRIDLSALQNPFILWNMR